MLNWLKPFRPKPDSFMLDGCLLVDGVDYHGPHDKELIMNYGYIKYRRDGTFYVSGLNFHPSTPPQYR